MKKFQFPKEIIKFPKEIIKFPKEIIKFPKEIKLRSNFLTMKKSYEKPILDSTLTKLGYTRTHKRDDWWEKWIELEHGRPCSRFHLTIHYGTVDLHIDRFRACDLNKKELERCKHRTIQTCEQIEKELNNIVNCEY
jgi:hypothetical protein